MRKILLMAICVALLPNLVSGQESAKSGCPSIYVEGPAGFVPPGELASYTARIDPPDKAVGVSYLWTVRTHDKEVGMVRGQGTSTIQIPWNSDHFTVTVIIKGLPTGCPVSGSETIYIDPAPVAEKLAEFDGSLKKAADSQFESILRAVRNAPGAQLYLIISSGRGGSIRSKRLFLAKKLAREGVDGGRITYVDSSRTNDRVVVWLVPAGATPPVP